MTRPSETYDTLVTVDESGIHDPSSPTVVAACLLERNRSESLVEALIESGVNPWIQKSTDLSTETLYNFFGSFDAAVAGQAVWGSVSRGCRGLMATEAVKDVLSKRETDSKSEENCLVLLDGQTSNYGGEENLLRSKTEILDPYFEQQVGVDIEFATLEKADRQYPEATVADCACCLYVEAVENEGIDAADTVERFDHTRSVPSVETDSRVYKIAPQGVTNADKFESKVVAWAVGKRTADEPLGTLDEQFERVIERKIDNQVIVDYILSIRSQPESQQA